MSLELEQNYIIFNTSKILINRAALFQFSAYINLVSGSFSYIDFILFLLVSFKT